MRFGIAEAALPSEAEVHRFKSCRVRHLLYCMSTKAF